MNGKAVKLSDYKGKIVVIDFWSTVCKPYVAAFPAFERADSTQCFENSFIIFKALSL
jgi:hypothetical protein